MARILVIDDEEDITSSIKKGLQNNGFEVDAYTEPFEALSDFRPNVYDLSLVDFKMPKMDGFDVYREIKRRDSDSKICFLTAYEIHFTEFKNLFPNSAHQCFIRKPVTIKYLISHVKSELNIS
ncbi:MAG: response regulator transcription factor [Nitrosotalea sp.]